MLHMELNNKTCFGKLYFFCTFSFQIMKPGRRLIHGNSQNLRIFFQNKGLNLYASLCGSL